MILFPPVGLLSKRNGEIIHTGSVKEENCETLGPKIQNRGFGRSLP